MNYFWSILIALFALFPSHTFAQKMMGVVYEKSTSGKELPLAGANVYWLNTTQGTTTRNNGVFIINPIDSVSKLVVSFVGYKSDTVDVTGLSSLKIELKSDQYLQEVVVEGWRSSTHQNLISGINVMEMNEKELFKAACCNLSESFDTNPSVDVSFSDAITGTRQIQLLGLSGPNTMISIENMPGIRGLSSSQGIQFIPGSWINSIQVTKGVGSVVNGYESLSGQINVELKSPQTTTDRLFVNGYVNESGRTEANVVHTTQVTKKWATSFLLHSSIRPFEMDQNGDLFLDYPKGNQLNFMNRWVYHSGNGWLVQFALKFLTDEKLGGQMDFTPQTDKFTTNRYGFEINSKQYVWNGKVGYQFKDKPYKSVGIQLSTLGHFHDSYYGYRVHDAEERYGYVNIIYQSIIGNTFSKFKTGVSFLYDDYREKLMSINLTDWENKFNRTEYVPGVFYEYVYDNERNFSLTAGIRADQHNLFGTIFTPRLHTKLNIFENTILRASVGKGTRVANVIMENSGFLASARKFEIQNKKTEHAYGFQPDMAWVYGLNLNQAFTVGRRSGNISVDYYYIDFENQVIADWDKSPNTIIFYPLFGKSFSQSIQAQVDYQLARRFGVRIAYKWLDVKTDYLSGLLQRPLVPESRAFVNLEYKTKSNYVFDYTIQHIGKQRIPNTTSNPTEYQLTAFSKETIFMNTQITKDFGNKWSVYVGVENITDFKLTNPIVSATQPFSDYFDSSMVWGPVFGRMWYLGFRYRLK